MSVKVDNIKLCNCWNLGASGTKDFVTTLNYIIGKIHQKTFLTIKEILYQILIANSHLSGLTYYKLKICLNEENKLLYRQGK